MGTINDQVKAITEWKSVRLSTNDSYFSKDEYQYTPDNDRSSPFRYRMSLISPTLLHIAFFDTDSRNVKEVHLPTRGWDLDPIAERQVAQAPLPPTDIDGLFVQQRPHCAVWLENKPNGSLWIKEAVGVDITIPAALYPMLLQDATVRYGFSFVNPFRPRKTTQTLPQLLWEPRT